MSFFFDVWTTKGFVLTSDVRLIHTDGPQYMHKLSQSPSGARVPCAVATSGDFCELSLNYFHDAVARKDTLRDVAHAFADRWTERYGGTKEYSAVHLVGFERIPGTERAVLQLWLWCNWDIELERYRSTGELHEQLASFSEPIPFNDHIPRFVKRQTGQFPRNLNEEYTLVTDFLTRHEPLFTWNGDTSFWRSAAETVASVMHLLRPRIASWDLDTTWRLAKTAMEFLAKVATFLPDSTVALSPSQECDILVVHPTQVEAPVWSKLPEPG